MPTQNELRRRIDLEFAAGWEVTVAVRRSDVIGFVALKPREGVLDQLFVRPALVGGGIGKALLAHAMAAMPKGFTLFTASSNAKARIFYEKAGLIPMRDDAHPRTGHPVTYYGWKVV
ncbi:GNAT family N-acetyltransferase [Rhizobium sp. KVB221]|uniref:GNAT family N-acetyltransferase n=1 Tax=Rhizobium setariae TaxID=2801340 RepID=A0A936YLV1_9HYPH|nr:GNAT family N-acetyltransferase [Rhizobium setariae]MBL0372805.1 GNAT family N-acetyltransferase [Rhizobium setariae]